MARILFNSTNLLLKSSFIEALHHPLFKIVIALSRFLITLLNTALNASEASDVLCE
jgi:hypothetical protein